jgi:bifunctional non-homologous end joining protein LigD
LWVWIVGGGPLNTETVSLRSSALPSTSVTTGPRLRYRRYDHAAILCAFDLIELDGDDLRPLPIEYRKRRLERMLRPTRRSQTGITLNEHYEGDGAVIYKHVCEFGCEGIVSKRVGSPYRSGRSGHWLKIKNPMAPAVEARGG